MKNILLASTAIVAFAGAAFADGHTGISFTGSASLGYNTSDVDTVENEGFYSDLDLVAGFAAELDNGLTAAASLNLDNLDTGTGTEDGFDYTLSLTSEMAGLYYGDTSFAAENHWASAGDMESDTFSEADGEVVLRGDVTFGDVAASISYALADSANLANSVNDLEQLSIGVTADFGTVNVALAYQEAFTDAGTGTDYNTANGDVKPNEVFGLSVGTTFGGADVRLAYAEDDDSDSLGIKASMPIGPVVGTVYFVSESVGDDNMGVNVAYSDGPLAVSLDVQDDQGISKVGLEGSYDMGNGLTAFAGYLSTDNGSDDRFYVAGNYDLGSGASVLVSFASDEDYEDEDETGAGDYQEGTTVELSFAF